MANEKQDGKVLFNLGEAANKLTAFFEKNSKIIYYTVGVIAGLVVIYFGVKYFYIEPKEKQASTEMFFAQRYFEADSLNTALNGDAQHLGFIDIIDQYGITKQGKLAKYYAGISYLRLGQFQDAVDMLSAYSAKEPLTYILSHQALGDAYAELGETQKAIDTYIKGTEKYQNDFLTAGLLFRAGLAYESILAYDKALDIYKTIREKYPQAQEAREMDKYIATCEEALK